MENGKVLNNLIPIIFIILGAVVLRLLPHPPNFSPIAALALFSGANLNGLRRYLLPILIMFLSDLFLGFHTTIPYVYGSFIIITLLGSLLKKTNFNRLLTLSLTSSLLFFLITNFGVWMSTNMYEKSVYGLYNAYIMGLPFLKNTMLGDIIYSFGLFYGYRYSNLFILNLLTRINFIN